MTTQRWTVVREFVGGVLRGVTHTSITTHPPRVGFRCDKPLGGSPYVVIAVYPAK